MFFSPPLLLFSCQLFVTVGTNGPGEAYRELWMQWSAPRLMPERRSEYMSEIVSWRGSLQERVFFRCHESVMVSFGIWGRGRTFSECLGTGLRTREFLTCRVGKPPRFGGFIVVHLPIFPLWKWPCGLFRGVWKMMEVKKAYNWNPSSLRERNTVLSLERVRVVQDHKNKTNAARAGNTKHGISMDIQISKRISHW